MWPKKSCKVLIPDGQNSGPPKNWYENPGKNRMDIIDNDRLTVLRSHQSSAINGMRLVLHLVPMKDVARYRNTPYTS